MKKIKDERLILKNLSNIRWAFFIENFAAICVLTVQVVKQGSFFSIVSYNNPVFLILMIGIFSVVVLSVNISVQVEDRPKLSGKRLILYFVFEWIFWSTFFFLIMSFKYIFIALVSGLIPAAVMTGVSLYANKFRAN